MVKNLNGNYYSLDQLDNVYRLKADMSKEEGTDGQYRGDTQDIEAIVKLINTKKTN